MRINFHIGKNMAQYDRAVEYVILNLYNKGCFIPTDGQQKNSHISHAVSYLTEVGFAKKAEKGRGYVPASLSRHGLQEVYLSFWRQRALSQLQEEMALLAKDAAAGKRRTTSANVKMLGKMPITDMVKIIQQLIGERRS